VGEEQGEWSAPIASDAGATPRWGIREAGREALSRYRVVERLPEHTLLELEPVTGRTNQLRLHCAHFGHPIVGDALFGRGPDPDLPRLFLHAHQLDFRHAATGEPMSFRSALPDLLAHHLTRLH
jgi:23S rRNA pseudouridine1911/1915/1917 synthase